MARNEEKQLARLNRYYLQQQKEEELKKRPPRPRLDTLTTVDDVKKWLPSILRDIDFYVKQMEVPCYPKRQIEEFEKRIDHLRGEYKAFIRKLRQLEPDLGCTPWSDRPYTGKCRKTVLNQRPDDENNDSTLSDKGESKSDRNDQSKALIASVNFTPIATPVLQNDSFYLQCYGYEKRKEPQVDDADLILQDQPLQFDSHYKALEGTGDAHNYDFDSATWRSVHNDAPLEFNWQGRNSTEVEELCMQNNSKHVQDVVSPAKENIEDSQPDKGHFSTVENVDSQQSQHLLHSGHMSNGLKTYDFHYVNSRVCDGSSRVGYVNCQSNDINSENSSVCHDMSKEGNVKMQGGLNIPYSDDEET